MARRGRFFRRRTGSNLTALIASLMREQRQAEDRAIFDAYRNGGLFKGQRVNDTAIIAYITSRRDSISADDPVYDQWNNILIQTKFSIGEQKIGLAFKEGRASAGDVAAFYRDQLKNLTPDSDFYRDVAGRAAEWAKAAAASARASAGSPLRKRIEAAEKGAAAVIAGFQSIDGILERAAREAGVIAGNQTLVDANASALFALIDRGVIGADGTPITYSEWQNAAVSSWKAQGNVIDLRKQAGASYIELQNQREKFMSNYLVQLNAADDRQKYEAARETWLTTIAESQGDPQAIIDANSKYAKTLTTIRDEAVRGTDQNDPDFIGGLASEINAVTGKEPTGPTVSDIYGASFVGEPGGAGGFATGSDAQDTYEASIRAQADADALASGAAYLGQAEPGGPLQVIPYPAGAAQDPFGRNGLDQSTQPSIEEINGKKRIVLLQGEPVRAAAYIDSEGRPVSPDKATQQAILDGSISLNTKDAPIIGYTFSGPTGKITYGVFQPNGAMLFTDENPFAGGGMIAGDGQSFVLTDAVVSGDNFVPNTTGLIKPVSLNPGAGEIEASLLATGTPVSSADMLRFIDTGSLSGVTEEDVQAIRAKSERDIAGAATQRRRKFGEDTTRPYNPVSALPPVLQTGLLSVLDTVRSGVQQTFGKNLSGSPDERLVAPPSAPTAPPPVSASLAPASLAPASLAPASLAPASATSFGLDPLEFDYIKRSKTPTRSTTTSRPGANDPYAPKAF